MRRYQSIALLACFAASPFTVGCDDTPKPSTKAPASATAAVSAQASAKSAAKPLPPLVLERFTGLGLTFQYPQPYVVETATSNPTVHQVAIDHNKEPGVLTIRFDPEDPGRALDLDEVAEATRQRMGAKATVKASNLEVAGKTYEARTVRSNQLGLIETVDTLAVVRLGEQNYVVLTHASDDDRGRAQRMFDTVLESLAEAE